MDALRDKKYVLAIDLGSGGIKTALVSSAGEVVAHASEPIVTYLLSEGGAEQDAEAWWNSARKTAKQVIRESHVPVDDILAVACDSQWSVVVPVDKQGSPLMRAVHWLDSRGGPYNRNLIAGFPGVEGYGLWKLIRWIRAAGLAPTRSGVDSLGHVLFIKNERPEIYAQTYKFLEPMDYLTSRLTGRITATQKTMAPFALVDTRRPDVLSYSGPLLKLAGLTEDKFPELIPNNGVVGVLDRSVARELGLNPATRVVAGVNDSNASAIGSGAVLDFEAIIYIGTSMYLTCHLPFKKTDLLHMMTSLPSPFARRYLMFGEQGAGGRCVTFYLKNIVYSEDGFGTGPMPDDAYLRFDAVSSEAPAGSGGVIFLPWLNGSIAPCEDPHVRGGFMNLSLSTRRSHLTRAVMEGIAFNNRWTRSAAEKFIGRKMERFRFAGGGALSDLWAQIHADVLGAEISQVDDPVNATVRGTALLALVSLGYRKTEDLPGMVKIKRVFTPDESNRKVYDPLYAQYRRLFKRNRKVFAALNP